MVYYLSNNQNYIDEEYIDKDVMLPSNDLLIPLFSGIIIFSSLILYHIHLSKRFISTQNDIFNFVNIHMITFIPIITYSFKLINIYFRDIVTTEYFFDLIYIEWFVGLSLIFTNLCKIADANLNTHMLIISCNLSMILCGYISYITQDIIISILFFIVSSLNYIYILVSLFTRLDIRNIGEQILKYKNIPYTSIDKLTYNILSYITIGSWNLYALVHILHKLDTI